MTTHHTDEKKPADGGLAASNKALLPSTQCCVWVGPETEHERWAVKNKLEEVLGRLDAIIWVLHRVDAEVSADRRLESLKHFAATGMQNAIALESLLFERNPQDAPRQSATAYFDSRSSR